MKTLFSVLSVSMLVFVFGCKKEYSSEESAFPVRLSFKPMANGRALDPTGSYLNLLGEDFTVSALKFYVGNVSLLQSGDGMPTTEKDVYHLVNAADASTLSFDIRVDKKSFSQLSFQIGVDSIFNVSGAQSGDLDPAKGMFWTWNSGYIMAKLEGTSSFSNEVNHEFVYHIGGFKEAEKTQRQVTLNFPPGKIIQIQKSKTPEIIIEVNIDNWFKSVHDLPIAAHPAWMTPGGLATEYADNYATMFTVTDIIEQ